MPSEIVAPPVVPYSRLKTFLGFMGLLYLLIALDLIDGVGFLRDVDDQLRLVQLRQLLATGHWFDLTLPVIRMPEVYVSPWSRLVDLPYFLLSHLFGLFLEPESALRLATWIWPPTMLAVFVWLALLTMSNINGVGRSVRPISVLASAIVMVLAAFEFSPGRIDHHNVQLVLMMMIFAGISSWTARGALFAGIAATLSVVVGLECMPFVVIAFVGLALAFLFNVSGGRTMLIWAGTGLFVSTLPAGLAFIGPSAMVATACDAYSAPYISALCGFAVILAAGGLLCGEKTGFVRRAAVLLLPAAVMTVLLIVVFPACAGGPYPMIDPVSKMFWFDRIKQENNVLSFRNGGLTGMTMMALVGLLAIIAFFARPAVADFRGARTGGVIVYGVAVSSLIFTLLLIRYIRFPAAFVPLFLPVLMGRLEALQESRSAGFCLVVLAVPLAVLASLMGGVYAIVPRHEQPLDAVFLMSIDSCQGEDFSVLNTLPPGMVMAPIGLSLSILDAGRPGLSVGAIPFHRASPGIRRSFLAFTTQDSNQRREALAPFDYIAVCRVPLDGSTAQSPLFAALAKDDAWPGLAAIGVSPDSRFRIFRIDHAALR